MGEKSIEGIILRTAYHGSTDGFTRQSFTYGSVSEFDGECKELHTARVRDCGGIYLRKSKKVRFRHSDVKVLK